MNDAEHNIPIGCIRRLLHLANKAIEDDNNLIYSQKCTENDIDAVHEWINNKNGVTINIQIK